MYSNANKKEIEQAQTLWGYVRDVLSFTKDKNLDISQKAIAKIAHNAAKEVYDEGLEARPEVLKVARFLANIDPAYKNSAGEYIHLSTARRATQLDDETLEYIIEKLYEVASPYVTVTTREEGVKGRKFYISSKISKKKLIHDAIRHLITGCEVMSDKHEYDRIKVLTLFEERPSIIFAYLVGVAASLRYKTVKNLMEDLVFSFPDQTERINTDGCIEIYDGTFRVERV